MKTLKEILNRDVNINLRKKLVNELKIVRYLHLVGGPKTAAEDHQNLSKNDDLKSLVKMHGSEKGMAAFKEKWQLNDHDHASKQWSDPINAEHPKYVHLQDEEEENRMKYYAKIYNKQLVDIRPGKRMNKIERDTLEFDHPMVRDEIPARYIRNIYNPDTDKWEPFNRKHGKPFKSRRRR